MIAARALLLVAALAGCAPAVAPPPGAARAIPQRVVSLNPCTDAILAEVADRGQIAAISHYSHDPRASSMPAARARLWPATRGTVEAVLALRPDLVLGSSFIDPATATAYARLGLRLERFGVARTLAESHAQVRRIAALTGHPGRGEALIARIDAAVAAAEPPEGPEAGPESGPESGAARPSAVIWQSGGIVPGRDALIVDLLGRAGLADHAAAQGLGQADHVSLERLLVDPPQALLIVGTGAQTGEDNDRLRFHPMLDRLEQTARFTLDPELLYCGGPTIIAASRRLAAIRRELAGAGGGQ